MPATPLNLKETKVAAIVGVFEGAKLAQPSQEYARLIANGRTAAYLSQRKDYAHLRFDHLAVEPTKAEVKTFGGADAFKGGCIYVTDANLDTVVTFAKRLVAETPAKEAPKPKTVPAEQPAAGAAKARPSR